MARRRVSVPKASRKRRDASCADLAGSLIGSLRGPRDASTNKRYLEEAIAADARRPRKR